MCRPLSQGGRRCKGPSCAESRRRRQREYQARRRAKLKAEQAAAAPSLSAFERAVAAAMGESPRDGWTGIFADLQPAVPLPVEPEDERGFKVPRNGKAVPKYLDDALESLAADGRFDLLDTPLTDEDRAEIAKLDVVSAGERITALRDHFNATLTVSMADQHHRADLAESVTRYIGDVSNAWVEGQITEQLSAAETFAANFPRENDLLNQLQKATSARMGNARTTAERDEALKNLVAVSKERIRYNQTFEHHAKEVGKARAAAVTALLSQTVGSSDQLPVGDITGQKRALRENLGEVERFYPDSWKQNTLNLDPLIIRPSKARAHYSANSPVKERNYIGYVSDEQREADYPVPTAVTVSSRRRYEPVEILVGGDPSNAEHVAAMEAARDRLERLDAEWVSQRDKKYLSTRQKAKPRWEVYTNDNGRLALRETFPYGTRIAGYESVIRVNTDKATLTHELAHRMEHANPHLRAVCEEFVRRRTTNADGVRDVPIRYLKDREPVYEDNLVNAYMGKMYKRHFTEVLSTGMEMLMHGEFGAGHGYGAAGGKYFRESPEEQGRLAADKEHLNLVLGLLVSAARVNENTTKPTP